MESPGISVPQAVSCCLDAGDPSWVPKEQLVLSPPEFSLQTPEAAFNWEILVAELP